MVQLSGVVERVTYHSKENGFCVLQVRVHGPRTLVPVIGHLPEIYPGESIDATGSWEKDQVHGMQFRADEVRTGVPTGKAGLEKFLASGMIKGVGSRLASDLVERFGTEVLEIIENSPARLRQIRGIGAKRVKQITSSWNARKSLRDLMLFFHQHGVGTARALRIHKIYGDNAVSLICENPYRLADEVKGIGFLGADTIARHLGFDRNSLARVRAGISYALGQAVAGGHCGLPRDELIRLSEELLGVEPARIGEALELELAEKKLIADGIGGTQAIFLARLYRAEQNIARVLKKLLQGKPPWASIDAAKAIEWAEKKLHVTLSPTQRNATRLVLRSKGCVITGGPGVGKTTLVNTIITILAAKRMKIALCAPTGRAAKRLSETSGREAKTIHRLLEVEGVGGGFRRGEDNPLECDLVVVDEVSMVDVTLMDALLRAIPEEASLLLVGDADQLPSVGPGHVLGDIIASEAMPVITLTEIFRQAKESRIIVNAHRINHGEMPEMDSAADSESDFYFIAAAEPERAVSRIVQLVAERIPARFHLDPMRDIQVLCPMNKGSAGVIALNQELQRALNGRPDGGPAVERLGLTYRAGDKVMQIQNDYEREVFNGDIGVIRSVDADGEILTVDFDTRSAVYPFTDLDELTLAYAITIHKSQGSEYPAVVIPLMAQHYTMLQRNLLYTAVTRARKLVILVGQEKAIRQAVNNRQARRRWTKLREWLERVA